MQNGISLYIYVTILFEGTQNGFDLFISGLFKRTNMIVKSKDWGRAARAEEKKELSGRLPLNNNSEEEELANEYDDENSNEEEEKE